MSYLNALAVWATTWATYVVGTILIPVPSWGPATIIEIIWLLLGLVTCAASVWVAPKVIGDYVLVERVPSHYGEARKILARGHIRREVMRFMSGAVVALIGTYAVIQPSPAPDPQRITLLGLFLTIGLLALSAFTIIQTVWDKRDRDRAEVLVAREDHENGKEVTK